MEKKILVLAFLILVGCSGTPAHEKRQLSQGAGARLSEVIRKNAESRSICPQAKEGEVCRTTWAQALAFCRGRGAHLPTAREYANLLRPLGTRILERSQGGGPPPAGYYLVDCRNPDGSLDAFYMNHSEYRRPPGDRENHLLWTASVPPQHPEYAHVYYNEWGGGGGKPADHRLDRQNAFQCVSE